ncbi:Uncharacterized lipoprotein NlpE involved in copper resistance [Ferrimonas sediminum]|uniref:Uncharacterized lipoprotein NlpE involved in copper resistance n=1 Tax=Ferrimonas sediminum TaxID=718193 RepID=A0A1G9ANF8_9GAMM|nr:copper resistance protein NlpE [Ferrimonas sediminum]SDK28130.1 Uncharacterized lipoprotein NlpE involved in copper resistance [Ferrimonas sediminum]
MKPQLISLVLLALLVGCQSPQGNGPRHAEAAVVADTAHTARNALDWPGTYTGTLPCADCDGVETELTLNPDGSYHLKQNFLGRRSKGSHYSGRFQWNPAGNRVTLFREGAAPAHYFVAENRILRLDNQAKRIEGPSADQYVLQKRP